MRCPSCGFSETKVTNSRLATEGLAVRRRRECAACSFRFTTHEERELVNLLVRKKGGSTETYQRVKLEAGIRKAMEKRPIPESKVRELIAAVEQDLGQDARREIESVEIGKAALKRLAELDEVAYIRFASVYKAFKSPERFIKEVQHLTAKK